MSQLEPYLFFNGNCADAIRFYEKALDGKLEMMMTASDWMGPDPYPGIRGVSVTLKYATVYEAKRKFDANWMVSGGMQAQMA